MLSGKDQSKPGTSANRVLRDIAFATCYIPDIKQIQSLNKMNENKIAPEMLMWQSLSPG